MLFHNPLERHAKTNSDTFMHEPSKWEKKKKGSLPNDITGMFYILFPQGMRASTPLLCQHTGAAAVRAANVHIHRRLRSVRAAGRVRGHNSGLKVTFSTGCPLRLLTVHSPNTQKLLPSIRFSRRL